MASIAGIHLYHLALMSPGESLELLSAVSGRNWPTGDTPDAADLLIKYCGRLPLALRIIGAILKKKPHWTLERIAEDLASEVTRLSKLIEGPLDVRGCFEISYRNLSESENRAFRLLSLLPLSVFKLGHASSFLRQSKEQTERLIEALVDAQLLETEDGIYFRFHDLLRLYGREQSKAANDDPDGALVASFIKELTAEFLDAYVQSLRENAWVITQYRHSKTSRPTKLMVAPPDSLYVQTRLADRHSEGYMYSWHEVLARHQRVLVIGVGGTGKTVLTDRICYEIAVNRDRAENPFEVAFSVPLRLRSGEDQSLERLIAGAVRSKYRLNVSEETISVLLQIRHTVVVFDGLDEVPFTNRGSVVRAIRKFCDSYPQVSVIVTSRPEQAAKTFAALDFQQFQIPPLSETDIGEYIRRWSQVRNARTAQASTQNHITPAKVRREWLSTPLLLAQLIEIYERTGVVPSQEIELYDAMYSAFFGSREVARGISRISNIRSQDFGRLVSYLTYELKVRDRGARGAADAEVYLLIKSIMREWHYPWSDDKVKDISRDLAALDLPVHRTIDASNGRPSWLVTRDSFR